MQIYEDFPLSEVLWYKIGGAARFLLEANTKEDVLEAFRFIKEKNITKYFVIGLGANLLVSDAYYDGAVVRLNREPDTRYISVDDSGIVKAFAGELLDDMIHFSFTHNLAGLEWAGGLPSTVGGSVRGNVGAFGHEIHEVVYSAEVLSVFDMSITTFSQNDMNFSYRSSRIKEEKDKIVLSASFHLKKSTPEEMELAKKTYHDNCEYRNANHPVQYPSCGSTFKNIVEKEKVEKVLEMFPDIRPLVEGKWYGKVSTGHLIQKLGFAGYKVGNAQASPQHPNFIVNLGGASFQDVYQIIRTIEQKFSETLGFSPQTEAEIIQ